MVKKWVSHWGCPYARGRELDPLVISGKVLEKYMGSKILVWPLFENTTCLVSFFFKWAVCALVESHLSTRPHTLSPTQGHFYRNSGLFLLHYPFSSLSWTSPINIATCSNLFYLIKILPWLHLPVPKWVAQDCCGGSVFSGWGFHLWASTFAPDIANSQIMGRDKRNQRQTASTLRTLLDKAYLLSVNILLAGT